MRLAQKPGRWLRSVALAAALVSTTAGLNINPVTSGIAHADTTTAGEYVPLPTADLLDTRKAIGTSTTTPVAANGSVTFQVAGVGGVPASGVSAVALNIVAVSPTVYGWATVSPSDALTSISTITFSAGQTTSGSDITQLTSTGKVTIGNKGGGTTHYVGSVRGYFLDATATGTGSGYHPVSTALLYDTRKGIGTGSPTTPVPANSTVTVGVAGLAGIPATGASAVALNIVTVNQTTTGWVSAYPSDAADPNVSSVSYTNGEIDSAFDVARLSSTGQIKITNHGSSTVDLSISTRGYFTAEDGTGSEYAPITPKIIVDTIAGTGVPGGATTPLDPGASFVFNATGESTNPAYVSAVALDIDARQPTAAGWLSVYPTGTADPNISSVAFAGGGQSTNGFDAAIPDDNGSITITNHSAGTVHLQISVHGFYMKQFQDGAPVDESGSVVAGTTSDDLGATDPNGGSGDGNRCVDTAGWSYVFNSIRSSHQGIGATQANYNGTSHLMISDFSAQTSGTVGITYSADVKLSASFLLASVETHYGITLSSSLTASLGNTTHATTDPGKTVHAAYGVWRKKTTGYVVWVYSNCKPSSYTHSITSYTPWYVGWRLWET